MAFKSFDVVSMVIEEANERFAPVFKPNDEKLDILKEYCDAIDNLIEEFSGESFDVEIDEIKMLISVKVEFSDITIEKQQHRFYDLIQRAVKCSFSAPSADIVSVEFVFPSIWDRAV